MSQRQFHSINYLATRIAATCDSVEHVYSVMSGEYEMGLAVHDNGDYSNGTLVTLFHWNYTHDPDLHEIEKHNIRWYATNGEGASYLMIYKTRKGRYLNFKGNRVYLPSEQIVLKEKRTPIRNSEGVQINTEENMWRIIERTSLLPPTFREITTTMRDNMYEKTEFGFELTPAIAEKVVAEIKPLYKLTGMDIENIMVAALEGGSNYWAGITFPADSWAAKPDGMPTSQFAAQLLLGGEGVGIFDIEDQDGPWVLTLDKLISGIALNVEHREHDCDLEDFDANTADCIIQYALFGEVIYG